MSTLAKTTHTPEDLLQMPDGGDYELLDGELVERKMSAESSYVAGEVFGFLRDFNRQALGGWVFPEGTSYELPQTGGRVRRADTSFVSFDRLPAGPLPKGHLAVAPNLAVEVVSPNDLLYQVEETVGDYFTAGSQLVWIANPANHTVRAQRADGAFVLLRADDEITGEDVLPGFRCRVADFFRPPAGTPE